MQKALEAADQTLDLEILLPESSSLLPSEQQAEKTAELMASFVCSYGQHKGTVPLAVWLETEFSHYPNLWSSEEERRSEARSIAKASKTLSASHADLHERLARGKSQQGWLAEKIEQGAAATGSTQVANYAAEIDTVLKRATEAMYDCVTTASGSINQNPSLHGFIAEQHHVNTFNADAAAKNSQYRAEMRVPEPGTSYQKNSVDIVIKDGAGKVVRRYQAKYCSTAQRTEQAFSDGQYKGQGKLVPTEQANKISRGKDRIAIDGVESKPLSHEDSQKMREQAQQQSRTQTYTWDDLCRLDVAKSIGKQALAAAGMGVLFQGGRILARRVWAGWQGKQHPDSSEDMREFFESSAKTGISAGLNAACTGALTVAARSGLISALKKTPAGVIAAIVYTGLEQAKIFYKLAKGEMDGPEAMNAMGNAACCSLGTLGGGWLGVQGGPP